MAPARTLVALAIIALTALLLLWYSKDISPGQVERVGPAFWPTLALLGILVGVAIKCVETLRRHRSEPSEAAIEDIDLRTAFTAIASCIIGVALIEFAGFVIANFVFLLMFLRIAGLKRKMAQVTVAASGTVAMVYLFVKLVYVPLPRGIGPFEDATIMLYRLLGIF